MSASRLAGGVVFGFALLTACGGGGGGDATSQCSGSASANCSLDAMPGCTGDGDCSGAMSVCETASGTCVACTTAEASACMGTSPVCNDNEHTCRGCTSHDECPASNVCLPSGACADANDVAYVSASGTGTTCTQASPCKTVTAGLGTNRPYVKITGTIDEGGTVTIDNENVTLLAAPGAKLVRTSNGVVLEIKGTSQVAIHDLEISGGSGAQGVGISLPTGNTATLELVHATVSQNAGGGITASGGTLTVSQSTLSGNAGGGITASGGTLTVSQSTISANTSAGITASGGTLTVSQSTISQNAGGGISVGNGTAFDITNCFIYRNGNQDSGTIGGIYVDGGMVGSNRIAFNTIVDNRIGPSGTKSGGLLCDIAGFSAPNNIIARNQLGSSTTASNAQTLGGCTFPTSKVQPDVTGLSFVSAEMAPYSYKLSSDSSAIDAATTPSTVDVDFDGDARPQGAAKDIGADEYRP